MKTIYILIVSCITFGTYAQDPQIFDNTWYLEKLVIDSDEIFPPSNFEAIFEIDLNFINISHPSCEDFLNGSVLSIDNATFSLNDDLINLIGSCTDQIIFHHYSIYGGIDSPPKNPFNYDITTENDISSLVITNVDGYQAFYNNTPPLSINENDNITISLYPNPVKDQLFFKTSISLETATVYRLNGKLVSKYNISNLNTIDTANLTHGLYFVIVEDREGNKITKKFVKN
jgi:hypothetical protein